jgi:hypothetical protein
MAISMMIRDLEAWERSPEFSSARRFLLEAGLRKELYGLFCRLWQDEENLWHRKRRTLLVLGNRDSKELLSAFQPQWFRDKIQDEFKFDLIEWRSSLLATYASMPQDAFDEMTNRPPLPSKEVSEMWNE